MTNLAEVWDEFTELDIDRMYRAWRWAIPNAPLATLPFVSRYHMQTALLMYTAVGMITGDEDSDFSTAELNRKLKCRT